MWPFLHKYMYREYRNVSLPVSFIFPTNLNAAGQRGVAVTQHCGTCSGSTSLWWTEQELQAVCRQDLDLQDPQENQEPDRPDLQLRWSTSDSNWETEEERVDWIPF